MRDKWSCSFEFSVYLLLDMYLSVTEVHDAAIPYMEVHDANNNHYNAVVQTQWHFTVTIKFCWCLWVGNNSYFNKLRVQQQPTCSLTLKQQNLFRTSLPVLPLTCEIHYYAVTLLHYFWNLLHLQYILWHLLQYNILCLLLVFHLPIY